MITAPVDTVLLALHDDDNRESFGGNGFRGGDADQVDGAIKAGQHASLTSPHDKRALLDA